MKIVTVANVPDELGHAWLQHLRDFDVAHPGCHFEIAVEAPDMTLSDGVEALKVDPPFDYLVTLEQRGKKP